MAEPTTLAYLAGVIDSDGYISIWRSVRKGIPYHAPRVGIAGTRRQPHDLAASLWGGAVGRFIPRNPQHRPQYQWSRQGGAAAAIIEAVRPYLLVKRDQADLALALCEHLEFGRCEDPFPWFGPDYDPKSAREEMHFEMVALNQSRSRRRELDGRTWDQYPTG